ncbi:DUF4856 domain-containing protein [Candidatus Endobugula sertula]|uniref:DUF4856 domain-containing protein n=1 Tax=Candidatus Endobugula sertula TaxID=62101 RepID=A0A1D2QNT7_9GAMM|nr:DUF4856 domain-containing protein [Candidatus Endobugula sertula]
MNTQHLLATLVLSGICIADVYGSDKDVYADFPITTKGYTGKAKTSVKYTGQTARHVIHNALKKLSSAGNGTANPGLKAQLLAYYEGKEAGRAIIDPITNGKFIVKQTIIDELSKGKNLSEKVYKGIISGWPGNMTGPEVLAFMIDKASMTEKGYDPLTGYDYTQLISKFIMGAVFYNQSIDNYLDEKLGPQKKPNNEPYKKGAAYTGKEHVWDEAFGYFGTPAHTMKLTAKDVYDIAKKKPEALIKADYNKDGVIDLKTEMAYGHAYYAAGFDKKGKTNYLHAITQAFLDGRNLIADAKGEALTDVQRGQLKAYADVIATHWEKVIAEAIFKYAGSTYKDLQKLKTVVENNGDAVAVFRDYAKHWSEMKGFALTLQTGKKNLGETAVALNRLAGFSPVLLGNTQISGVDANGDYTQKTSDSLEAYMLHMLKIQKLMVDEFSIQARVNDVLSSLDGLAKKLSSGHSAEND